MPKQRTLADFQAAHDIRVAIPIKIRAGLASLRKEFGPEAYEYPVDFARRCGVNNTMLAEQATSKEFKPHVIEAPAIASGSKSRVVWFADAKVAARAFTHK